MNKILFAAVAVAVVTALAGCSTQPTAPVDDKSTTGTPTDATPGTTTSGATTPGVAGAPGPMSPLKDPNNILSKRSIYFEYDSFVVEDKYKAQIDAHARYMTANRSAKVTLQGNTDERGSREYNIALGQKRADAVKRAMTLMGVQEIAIETVSFGKEKPRRDGHDEASWAENRRVDIIYFGE
jgi:peptidoglycan-associated lipoprotein